MSTGFKALALQDVTLVTDIIPNEKAQKIYQGISIDVDTTALIFEQLPQYQLSFVKANNPRSFKLIENGKHFCAGNKILTQERQKHALVGQLPQVVFPGLRLFIRNEHPLFAEINRNLIATGKLSLTDLFQYYPKLKIAVIKGRSYGEAIDALINDSNWQQNFWQRSASDMSVGALEMLKAGRVDLLLEYSNVVEFYNQQANYQLLVSYPVKESAPYVLGYYYCSKGELGRQVLNDIDQVIKQLSKTPAYFESHSRWFDQSSQQDLKNYYNQVFGTNF
jgi:uncharacterized protein (TIGR02285 family)